MSTETPRSARERASEILVGSSARVLDDVTALIAGHDSLVTALRAELAAATAEVASVREESDERYKEAREIERRAQTYSDMAESLRGSYVEASAEVRRLTAELAAVTERAERARAEEREKVFAEIRTALALVVGFRPAALKVGAWKAISDEFPENAALARRLP